MKLIVEKDNGEREVFQNITDLYIAARYPKPLAHEEFGLHANIVTTSHSWASGNFRDVVKEVRQSLVELEDHFREKRNGGSS